MLDTPAALTPDEIDARISFLDELQIMEIDFRDLHLHCTAEVNAIYDRVEERIEATGEPLWFFLIDYGGTQVEQNCWFSFSRRGKALNLAHSMGTVRFDTTECTRAQIERDAGTEAFDPNLFCDRDKAIARLQGLPSQRRKKIVHVPTHTPDEIAARIRLRPKEQIADIDLSGYSFAHSRDVDDFEDALEARLEGTGQRWFFLMNYEGTQIDPSAWVRFAQRGKAMNERFSLGSVRYAPGSETEVDIRMRAESGGFRPNIRNTRDEALARIEEIRAELAH
ncbi:MAG: hypothetical protein AAFQ36_06445 [Pseudomonadota bacterium]